LFILCQFFKTKQHWSNLKEDYKKMYLDTTST